VVWGELGGEGKAAALPVSGTRDSGCDTRMTSPPAIAHRSTRSGGSRPAWPTNPKVQGFAALASPGPCFGSGLDWVTPEVPSNPYQFVILWRKKDMHSPKFS